MTQNERQRLYRLRNGNAVTKRYEKTHKGFLMRVYRNMKSRIVGIQKKSAKIYSGKELLDKSDFYQWSLSNKDFFVLWDNWVLNNYNRKLSPSIDRIDPDKGYTIDNIRWITLSENSRLSRQLCKKVTMYSKNGDFIAEFGSVTKALNSIGIGKKGASNISVSIKRNTSAYGYKWKYGDCHLAKII